MINRIVLIMLKQRISQHLWIWQVKETRAAIHQCDCFLGGESMLRWALIFLIIALVAALFGFTGIAAAAAGIAKFLFFLFLVVCLILFVIGISAGRRIP
jgi:uncharacterized membrane protein YtjA (UPF0391 family)